MNSLLFDKISTNLFAVYLDSTLNFLQILTTLYQILMVLANLLWGHSSEALKLLPQMALTGKPDLQGNVTFFGVRSLL
jgi:hypothetical protein